MTEETTATTLTAEQILKSKSAFSDYVQKHHREFSNEITKDYPKTTIVHTAFAQLTQNIECFANLAELPQVDQYIFWYVVNEREESLKSVKILNNMFKNGCGIFVVKAVLNGDKIEFIAVLSPEIKHTSKREVNTNTPVKNLQLEYWQLYSEICDAIPSPDVQIVPAQKHWQYLPVGKAHSQLLLTLNVTDSIATVEFLNNKDENKKTFEKLILSKLNIEKSLGELEWHELQGKKSSKIKAVIRINDINNREEWKSVIKKQIQTAEQFRTVIPKYL